MKTETQLNKPPQSKKTIAAVVGAGAAATLMSFVPQFEGTILRGYKDPIGIVTACTGHTRTAVLGKPYTKEECAKILDADLVEHAEGVLKCTPVLATHRNELAASVSFAFNVGTGAYCNSTMAKKFNAGDFMGACEELYKWTCASVAPGKGDKEGACANATRTKIQLKGLYNRRNVEVDMCKGNVK